MFHVWKTWSFLAGGGHCEWNLMGSLWGSRACPWRNRLDADPLSFFQFVLYWKMSKIYSAECSFIPTQSTPSTGLKAVSRSHHEWKGVFRLPYTEPVRHLEESQRANTEMKIESQQIKRLALPSLGTSYLVLSLYWLSLCPYPGLSAETETSVCLIHKELATEKLLSK